MSDYYVSQSRTSDPGRYGYLFDDLPADLAGISQVIEGLIYHYFAGQRRYGWVPPKERLIEINTRWLEQIVAALLKKDKRPLIEGRAYEQRLIGCCRDFALVACAILRHQGKPARLRYGFASYLVTDYWIDHVIVELWNGQRWQPFEPRSTARGQCSIDLLNLPSEAFVAGGRAWQMCRNEGADPDRFGLGPQSKHARGWRFIRERLQLDVAALNKIELLCWDTFEGLSEDRLADKIMLDELASCSLNPDSSELRERCATEKQWHIPTTVHCHHPATGSSEVSVCLA
jgi:Transglutaminase-like superfamily